MPTNNIKLQVKSSGQYLNSDSNNYACQDDMPTSNTYLWEMTDAPGNLGWSLLQVKKSNQYLYIDQSSLANGAYAKLGSLPAPIPDNFLWKKMEAPGNTGWSLFQVKHSLQYLNIFEGGVVIGAYACQGYANTTDNFFWLQQPNKDPKAVKIDLQINCQGLYDLQPAGGAVSEATANEELQFSDDNNGHKENNNQSSFESIVNAGSNVTWKASIEPTNPLNSNWDVRIDSFQADSNSQNVFNLGSAHGNSGKYTAQVLWTAIPPDSGDNETYTVNFSIKPKSSNTWVSYSMDPKIRIDPMTSTTK